MPTTDYYNRYNAQDYGSGYRRRSNYYQGYQPQGIISMFDPGSMDMIAQAASSRQQRFDAGSTVIAQERARIAGMETADPVEASKQLRAFEEKLNEKIQGTYGGDYGAAVNSITNLIGAERSNPFYKFNTGKIKALDSYNKAKLAMGADFMAAKDPNDISFEDYKKGQTDFSFTPVNRQSIVKRSANVFSQYANQLMNQPDWKSTQGGIFLERVSQYGFSDKEGMEEFVKNNPTIVEDIMNTPGLEGLDKTAVYEAIMEGAHAGIGQSQVEVRAHPDHITAYQKANLASKGGGDLSGGLSFTAKSKVPIDKGELYASFDKNPEIIGNVTEMGKKYGLNISSYSDAAELSKKVKQLNRLKIVQSIIPGQMDARYIDEVSAIVINALGKFGNFINPFTPLTTKQNLINLKSGTTPIQKFADDFERYNETLPNTRAINMYKIDRFMTTLNSSQRAGAKDSRDVLDEELYDYLKTYKEGFKPTSNRDARDSKEIRAWDEMKVTDIGFDDKTKKLYVNIIGKSKLGKEKEKQIEIHDFTMMMKLAEFYQKIEGSSGSRDGTWRDYYKDLYKYSIENQQ